jgi:hypothetical protein
MVSAWPEPPFAMPAAIIADVHDGMRAFARATTTIERPFFPIRLSETEARSLRWLCGSRKAPRPFAMRGPGAKAWATPWSFFMRF